MKSPLLLNAAGSNYRVRAIEKQRLRDQIRTRGTVSIPDAPRDVQVQPGTGGVLVTWKEPEKDDAIEAWRIYLNTESNLAVQIRDRGTRQAFVPLSSGVSPASVNVMVSAVSALGRESSKVIKSATPLSQATTTTVPTVPPGFLEESAGGGDRGLVKFRGRQQYVR